MRNSLLNLIKITQSLELAQSNDLSENNNETPKQSNVSLAAVNSQKSIISENKLRTTISKQQKIRFSTRNYKKSFEFLEQEVEDCLNEGLIQKKIEMHLVLVKFPFPVISPFGHFIKIWNLVIIILMIYTTTIFPIRLSSDEDDADWIIIDLFVDSIFMFDVVINTITAYEDINGNLIFHLPKIILHYLKGWFFLDLISSIPFYLMIKGIDLGEKVAVPSIYSLVKILKFFRLIKMTNFLTSLFLNFRFSKETIEITKLIMFVLFLLHITSCLWMMVAKIEENPGNWIVKYQLIDDDFFTIYIASIYYLLTVLITLGYGNVTATTNYEKAFVCVFMFVGIGCFGYIMGSFINHYNRKINGILDQIQKREFFFIQLGQAMNIPTKTLEKILIRNQKLHISNTIIKINAFQKQELFNDLPFSLYKELFYFIYSELIDKIEFFHDKPYSFLVPILSKLRPIFLKKGDEVYREGDIATEVYFIMKGRVVSKCRDKRGSIKTVIFMEGGYFGEADIIFKRERWESAFAETDVEIWKIYKKDFLKILKSFKEIKTEIKKLVLEKLKFRKASSLNFISSKYLLPATYFLSKLSKAKKSLKSVAHNIIRKSQIAMNERRKRFDKESRENGENPVDLRKLYLKNESMKKADKNQILETTPEEIEQLGIKEMIRFFNNQGFDLEIEDCRNLSKISKFLEEMKENLNKLKINFTDEKLDSIIDILKILNSVLKSQQEELLAKYKFTED